MGRVGNIGGDENLVGMHTMSDAEKTSIRRSKIRDIIFNGIMFFICLYLPMSRKKDGQLCDIPIIQWLIMQSIFFLSGLVRNVVILNVITHMEDG
jgi:hypothetical protein